MKKVWIEIKSGFYASFDFDTVERRDLWMWRTHFFLEFNIRLCEAIMEIIQSENFQIVNGRLAERRSTEKSIFFSFFTSGVIYIIETLE